MKILLVNPSYKEVYNRVRGAEGATPPIGLAYLASYLRIHCVEVQILDVNAQKIRLEELGQMLSEFDVVGTSSYTPSLKSSLNILELAKKNNPSCRTVLGGPHITALPVETMESFPVVDFGVLGEGEISFLELIESMKGNNKFDNIDGIVYRDSGKIRINRKRKLIGNLDKLPFPSYESLPLDKYIQPLHHINFSDASPLNHFMLLITSRGCACNCTFCASKNTWGRTVRYRSAENVLQEMDLLVNRYNINVLDIADDNFLCNKERLNCILDGIIRKGYRIRFNCSARVDMIDKGILKKLKEAGCYLIRFGVESGDPFILQRMKKGITVEQVKRAFKLSKETNINTSASFIIGYPGESRESFKRTMMLAKTIDPDIANFFIAIPFPGTEFYEIAKNEQLIENFDYSKWKLLTVSPSIKTNKLRSMELSKMVKRAYLNFYFRPSYILKRMKDIKHLSMIKSYFKGLSVIVRIIK